ncbi:MAG: hypothetical protein WBA45_07325 [Microthrixaceae bacterium]
MLCLNVPMWGPTALWPDCFGTSWWVTVGGYNGKLSLPLIRENQRPPGQIRRATVVALGESNVGPETEWDDWGRVNSYTKDGLAGLGHLSMVHLQLHDFPETELDYLGSIQGRGAAQGDVLQDLFRSIDAWMTLLRQWVGATSDQFTGPRSPFNGNGTDSTVSAAGHGAVVWVRDSQGRCSPSGNNHMEMYINDSEALTLRGLQYVLERTCSGVPAPPARVFLARARNGLLEHDFRSSVVDAATAVELALWKQVDMDLSGVAEPVRKRLTKGLTLGSLREVAAHVGLPPSLNPDLIALRNRVAHKGYEPTLAETGAALNVVTKVVDQLVPAPIGLSARAG